MKVDKIESKSSNIEDLQEYLAELSSVVRDKSPSSAEKLWNRLLTETVPYTGGVISYDTYLELSST